MTSISDKMRSEDVDLSADIPFFKAKTAGEGGPGVTCTTIYQCKNFSVIFFPFIVTHRGNITK